MKRLVSICICLLAACLAAGCSQDVQITNPHPGWTLVRPIDQVLTLAADGSTIWAGGKTGVVALDQQSGAITNRLVTDPPMAYVRSLLVGKDHELYIGHNAGLTVYDGKSFKTYTTEDGLPDNCVYALMRDREGRLWVGTWGGVGILENGKWSTMTSADGLIVDMVNVIRQDSTGGMWFGSTVPPRGGISYLKNGKWQTFDTNSGLPHNSINGICEDAAGNVWLGTGYLDRGGAVRFQITSQGAAIQQVLLKSNGLAGEKVRSVFHDHDGVMWFGSEYDGLARFDGGKWQLFDEKDGLADQEVMSIMQDADGTLWFGGQMGVLRLDSAAQAALK